MNTKKVLEIMKTTDKGLTNREVEKRQQEFGVNILEKKKTANAFDIFFRQFSSFMVLILIIAVVISYAIGETFDAVVISVIVILNAIFGFVQEYRAKKAIEALRKLAGLKTKVVRNNKEIEIDSSELVPGDIILLDTGSKIAADARIIEASAFMIDEASLTGESVPSRKVTSPYKPGTTIADQENMAFSGTVVTAGHGKAVIVKTGMQTEMGKIAKIIQEDDDELTPLQENLKKFGVWLGITAVIICIIIFSIGVIRGYVQTGEFESKMISEMFLASVALVVAAIPEGLPAIVTISLALGVGRMARRNALVRKLPSVETLGCTDVICSDKTGTLTKNEMTVTKIYCNNQMIDVSGHGYNPKGKFELENRGKINKKTVQMLMKIGALCNNSRLIKKSNKYKISGDPTEGSLIVSAIKFGLSESKIKKLKRDDEIAFDSKRKRMSVIYNRDMYTKGAPDEMLKKCKYIYINGRVRVMNRGEKREVMRVNDEMAEQALRVLAFAYKKLPKIYKADKKLEKEMIFVGLQAMIDPPRVEVIDAIKKCRDAQIRPIIITGDHMITAIAIAKKLKIYEEGDGIITGGELDKITDYKLDTIIEKLTICARASPEHKVRILNSLKRAGHIVAMTGDGVNDAPAITKADIGIAMGIVGTDVAKEASDMILTDDDFASIVNAVEEGRRIYNSIQQFVQYTLSSNLGELISIFIAVMIGWPLPLIAIQILWVNLLTDGLPGLALGMDKPMEGLMKKPPRKRDEQIVSAKVVSNILLVGFIIGFGTLMMFFAYGIDNAKANSVAFTTLICFQMFHIFTYRAKKFIVKIKHAKYLIGAVLISIAMQIAVLYTPLNEIFKTVPLNITDWIIILLVTSTAFIIPQIKTEIESRIIKV